MIDAGRLLAFAATAFILIVIPGPSVLFVISRAVALGRRAALATVAGCGRRVGPGHSVGVGVVVQRSLLVFSP